jgi:hypothetical protein
MIKIKTQTGCWLDSDDSKFYIQYELRNRFSGLNEYIQCLDLYETPNYWGEYILNDSEIEYKLWITKVAQETFDK